MGERTRESIRIKNAAGGHLAGVFCSTGPASHALLYVHGFGSSHWGEKSQALEAVCARRGWPFAAFDFRGHGQSTGALTDLRCSDLLADLDEVHRFLRGRGVEHVFPVGSSMGGWAAAWWASRNASAVPACTLVAPAFRFPSTILDRLTPAQHAQGQRTGRFRVRNQWLDVELDYALVADARPFTVDRLADGWTRPALILHGMRDEVVPYEHTLDFVQRARGHAIELRLYKDGDHRLVPHKDDIAESACAFFARFLPRGATSA